MSEYKFSADDTATMEYTFRSPSRSSDKEVSNLRQLAKVVPSVLDETVRPAGVINGSRRRRSSPWT